MYTKKQEEILEILHSAMIECVESTTNIPYEILLKLIRNKYNHIGDILSQAEQENKINPEFDTSSLSKRNQLWPTNTYINIKSNPNKAKYLLEHLRHFKLLYNIISENQFRATQYNEIGRNFWDKQISGDIARFYKVRQESINLIDHAGVNEEIQRQFDNIITMCEVFKLDHADEILLIKSLT